MNKILTNIIGAVLSSCIAWSATYKKPDTKDTLWYTQAAPLPAISLPWAPDAEKDYRDAWESQTLPVGNGRIGATCYGGIEQDCLVLNEVSLWSGGPNLPGNGSGYAYGPKMDKNGFGSYQPFAHLVVQYEGIGKPADYTRSLKLKEGTAYTTFTTDEGKSEHERSCFVSKPDDVLVYTASTSKRGGITANVALLPFHTVTYAFPEESSGIEQNGEDTICMKGTLVNGEVFEGRVQVRVEGGSFRMVNTPKTLEVNYKGGGIGQRPTYRAEGVPYIRIEGATSFSLIVTLATDYKMSYEDDWKGEDPSKHTEKTLRKVRSKKVKDMHAKHMADFSALYNRVSLTLGKSSPELTTLPTNERLKRYQQKQNDPELEALIYQYGRYMLIAGSRAGNLPLNLQGIWNNKVHAPWASDYHNNINLQMCYWGAEVANLSECHIPFLDFIRAMQTPLHIMTQKQYGDHVRGWTTRISQNPWGGGGWLKWNPPVNAWYALHLWDHYLFTQDREYLSEEAYPILKNICNFWEDSLKELGEHGEGLISAGKPMNVKDFPELKEIHKGALVAPGGWSHEWGPVEDGCTHDQQLVWELFDITTQAAAILGKDKEWASQLEEKKKRLVGNRIGKGGYLQEWIVDRPNMVTGHRHTSHLIGVYPGSTISLARTPELAKAAMKSLELRGTSGDNRHSWTWPWRTALWARFHDANKAHEMVRSYLIHNTLSNLFGNHPPMQLDGTYGMTGAISEMLVQSHSGQIELLPALPAAWKDGAAYGLRARGNITINMKWRDGRVTKLELLTSNPKPAPVTVVRDGKKTQMVPRPLKTAKLTE